MRKISRIIIAALALFAVGCNDFANPFGEERLLAKVGGVSLYLTDVESIFTPGLTPHDSTRLLESYVDMWVKKQLKIQAAEKLFSGTVRDIDSMVTDYRNSLLSYKLDQYFVDERIDTTFTADQIKEYYETHRSDFILDRTMVKGKVVKVPNGYRQKTKLRDLMRSHQIEARQDFMDIVIKNDFDLVDYLNWTEYSEFLSHIPSGRSITMDKLPALGTVSELYDPEYTYFAVVTEARRAGDFAPVEIKRIQDVIKRVLLNQRKQEIIRAYEDSIYQKAVDTRWIIVNTN